MGIDDMVALIEIADEWNLEIFEAGLNRFFS
jgi:hypothetical protein